ncbi:MAG: hypothetical protein OEY94_02975 [Alphaproteobacteria bacterium]|nr:hypothetical protein [Alphaproteobacteria bacterium]
MSAGIPLISMDGSDLEELKSDFSGLLENNSKHFPHGGGAELMQAYINESDVLRSAIRLIDQWKNAGKTTVTAKDCRDIPKWNHMHWGADPAYQLVNMPDSYTVS